MRLTIVVFLLFMAHGSFAAGAASSSLSENVGQASSLPVHGASAPRVSGGRMPPEPADKRSSPQSQPGSPEIPSWLAHDRLGALHATELETIRRFQHSFDFPWLMKRISDLGPSRFMMALISFVLFCLDPRLGVRLGLLFFASSAVRDLFALALHSPRPYWLDANVATFTGSPPVATSYGLPSGHAMVGTTVWLFLAAEVRRPWAWVAGPAIAILICVSRVYLGMHFMSDVALGFVLGALLALVWRRLETPAAAALQRQSARVKYLSTPLVPAAILLAACLVRNGLAAYPEPEPWAAFAVKARTLGGFAQNGGAVFGLAFSLAQLHGRPWAGAGGPWLKRLTRWIASLAAVYGIVKVGGWLSPDQPVWLALMMRFMVWTAATWFLVFGSSRVFLRLNLAEPQPELSTSPLPAGSKANHS